MNNCRATSICYIWKIKMQQQNWKFADIFFVETSSASPLFHKIKRLAVSNDRNRGKNDLEKIFSNIFTTRLKLQNETGAERNCELTHSSGQSCCCCCYCIGKCNWKWNIDTSHWKHKIIVRSLQKICSSQKIVIVIQISYLVSKLLWLVDIFFYVSLR